MSARPTPAGRSEYVHFCPIRTRWMDNDAYRHVNNVLYTSFFDTAVNDYLIANDVLDLEKSEVICFVVETKCSFFRPVAFPDVLEVGLRVTRLGGSSVHYDLAIFREGDNEAAAQGYLVHVCVDRASNRAVPMPEYYRVALEPLCVSAPVHENGAE